MQPEKAGFFNEVKKVAKQIAALPVALTNVNYGDLNFNEIHHEIAAIQQVARDIELAKVEWLSPSVLNSLREPLKQCHHILNRIISFVGTRNDSPKEHQELVELARNRAETLMDIAAPALAYTLIVGGNLLLHHQQQVEVLAARAQAVQQETETLRLRMINAATEADGALKEVRGSAARAGIGVYISTFAREANVREREARFWLAISGVAAAFGLAAILTLFVRYEIPADAKSGSLVQLVLLRIVVVTFVSFLPLWCIRNYRNQRHLGIVNRHRETALATFQTFVAATTDEGTRNAVLLEATRCIFAPAQTGYLGGDESMPTDRVLEIVKTAIGKDG